MDSLTSRTRQWTKYLIAIVLGNLVYSIIEPHLPPAAQHRPYRADIGLFVDLWFCVVFYGLIELLASLTHRHRH
ncbi:MAG: hypothetical protein EPN47_20395 [Acidobacteria bacterium]|nr:MAG: hypothetical protein EPN47_20395 [Acidobacteriota bacterium]